MRLTLGVALLVVAVVCATAGTARAGTQLIVTGHGWGHGVGMSQWGAYGYARHGWKYRRILAHYYPGTKLSHNGEPRVRVLLAQGASSITVGCATPIRVTDGKRLTRTLPAGTYGIGSRLVFPVRRNGGGFSFGHVAVLDCARAPLTFDGREYHGTLVLWSRGGGVSVVNGLSLDTYLRGVVPSESPSHWPLAALEAQAVAARSYALAELHPTSWYDLVPTTADQVYGGVRAERPRSDRAVYATLGQVLTWDGQVARTYYSSSSGGRTESVQDAWPGACADPVPALGAGSVRHVLPSPRLGPVQLLRVAPGIGAGPGKRRRVGTGATGRQPAGRVGSLPPGIGWHREAQRESDHPVVAPAVDLVLGRTAVAFGEQRSCALREPRDDLGPRAERERSSAAGAEQ